MWNKNMCRSTVRNIRLGFDYISLWDCFCMVIYTDERSAQKSVCCTKSIDHNFFFAHLRTVYFSPDCEVSFGLSYMRRSEWAKLEFYTQSKSKPFTNFNAEFPAPKNLCIQRKRDFRERNSSIDQQMKQSTQDRLNRYHLSACERIPFNNLKSYSFTITVRAYIGVTM